ncbi:hypothetical protein V8G54_034146 [Vigna mungo]|uniref:Uncharacterized protein n=1 Tax=Vigna mungo TaxID=3915 RepID=A0AAQ3RH09_VIGMU
MWSWTNRIASIIPSRDSIISLVLCYSSRSISIKPYFILPPFTKIIRCSCHWFPLLGDYPINKSLCLANLHHLQHVLQDSILSPGHLFPPCLFLRLPLLHGIDSFFGFTLLLQSLEKHFVLPHPVLKLIYSNFFITKIILNYGLWISLPSGNIFFSKGRSDSIQIIAKPHLIKHHHHHLPWKNMDPTYKRFTLKVV